MDAPAWKTVRGIGREAGAGTQSRDFSTATRDVFTAKSVHFQLGSKCAAKFKSCKNPESFPPTPFSSPPLLFPVPLKLNWINKTIEEVEGCAESGINADESRDGLNCSAMKTSPKIDNSNAEEKEENVGKCGLLGPEDSPTKVAEKNPRNSIETHDNSGTQGRQGNCISTNNGKKPEISDDSERASHANWVGRIIGFGFYWKEEKKCDPDSSSNGTSSSKTEQADNSSGICESNCDSNHPDQGCEGRDDFLCYMGKQKSTSEVTYDRDSFSKLLHPVSLPEMKVYAQMAFLCDRAYTIPQIKPAELWKLYRLRFVSSSVDKTTQTIAKVVSSNPTANAELPSTSISSETEGESNSTGNGGTNSRLSLSPSVAYEIAASAASYIHSQTKYIIPFKFERRNQADNDENLVSGIKQDAVADTDISQMNKETEKDAEDASVEHKATYINNSQQRYIDSQKAEPSELSAMPKSEMAAIVATSSVTALLAAENDATQAAARDLQPSSHPPPLCEWFICDEDGSYTRYFVIKGSDSLASWQANLFFEPMQFEGFEVSVHRGIYEAAKGMYEQLLPDILSHLRRHGEKAKFRFVGHSLGGSLSLLLNLMLLIRGVTLQTSLLPVVTFGSPCVMCGGNYLLQKLGLPNNHVQAVMMHRDIVPRSFACNYPNHVADVLKRLNFSFQDHPCLNFQNILYGSMGQLLILQPHEKFSPPHPLLPSGCGFYRLPLKQDGSEHENELSGTLEAEAAQSVFLNTPHPLETLSDRCAYGPDGSISRDHNSISYLKVISYILKQQIRHRRKLQREQRRQVWLSLVTTDSSKSSQRPFKVAKENELSEDLTGEASLMKFNGTWI